MMSGKFLPNIDKQRQNRQTPGLSGTQQLQSNNQNNSKKKHQPNTVASFLYDSQNQDIGQQIDKSGWVQHLTFCLCGFGIFKMRNLYLRVGLCRMFVDIFGFGYVNRLYHHECCGSWSYSGTKPNSALRHSSKVFWTSLLGGKTNTSQFQYQQERLRAWFVEMGARLPVDWNIPCTKSKVLKNSFKKYSTTTHQAESVAESQSTARDVQKGLMKTMNFILDRELLLSGEILANKAAQKPTNKKHMDVTSSTVSWNNFYNEGSTLQPTDHLFSECHQSNPNEVIVNQKKQLAKHEQRETENISREKCMKLSESVVHLFEKNQMLERKLTASQEANQQLSRQLEQAKLELAAAQNSVQEIRQQTAEVFRRVSGWMDTLTSSKARKHRGERFATKPTKCASSQLSRRGGFLLEACPGAQTSPATPGLSSPKTRN